MTNYDQDISRVCDYINQNLDKELSLDALSIVSGFSKYHFHRIFSARTGLSLIKFIQISRLRRASFRLTLKAEMKIIDIAYEAGFDSAEAFSRAFKREFKQTPSAFRKAPEWIEWHKKSSTPSTQTTESPDIKVVHFKETKVAVLEHHGAPELIYETTKKFIEWRKESKLSPIKTSKTFGIVYADPKRVKADDFRVDLCGSVEEDVPTNTYGITTQTIPSGPCAVFRHSGSFADISHGIYYLYSTWLGKNNAQCRDFPLFFHYINTIYDVDEHELLTDIYLPIK